jgi:hypothetical protein
MSAPPSTGFSGVADAANINGLAGDGWQKLPVVFYRGPVSEIPESAVWYGSRGPQHLYVGRFDRRGSARRAFTPTPRQKD